MYNLIRPIILVAILFTSPGLLKGRAQSIDPSPEKLQEMIRFNLKQAYAASVFLADYDTINKRFTGPRFSGVVVNKSGLILTAGHASRPGRVYLVQFPNDKKNYIAIGAGRIALFDAAMVKINDKKDFPFAEMGWSSSLVLNEPCISIAYPGSFSPQRVVLRFGYIAELENNRRKMLRSTCLMEPGDSGGPVFDLLGRVIGVRSNILPDLKDNFDVPIDVFRRYWTALQKSEDYQFLPEAESFGADPLLTQKVSFSSSDRMQTILTQTQRAIRSSSIALVDHVDSLQAVGTLIDVRDLDIPGISSKNTYLISKSSLLGDTVSARLGSKLVPVKVIYRNRKSDLVLLELDRRIKGGLIASSFKVDTIGFADLGSLILSVLPDKAPKISVIGSMEFDLPGLFSYGYLGLTFSSDTIVAKIGGVQPNSPASTSGLKAGDQILAVNQNPVQSSGTFTKEVQKHSPGESISVRYRRAAVDTTIRIKLGKRPTPTANTFAEKFIGGRSDQRDGFENVFVHDGMLTPRECGSPIFDLSGKFRGINMARYSRTSNLAVSPAEIEKFIKEAFGRNIS